MANTITYSDLDNGDVQANVIFDGSSDINVACGFTPSRVWIYSIDSTTTAGDSVVVERNSSGTYLGQEFDASGTTIAAITSSTDFSDYAGSAYEGGSSDASAAKGVTVEAALDILASSSNTDTFIIRCEK